MLYCIFYNEEIIGRFLNKDKAISYLIDLWFEGISNATIKTMTKKEYENYVKILILEEREEITK